MLSRAVSILLIAVFFALAPQFLYAIPAPPEAPPSIGGDEGNNQTLEMIDLPPEPPSLPITMPIIITSSSENSTINSTQQNPTNSSKLPSPAKNTTNSTVKKPISFQQLMGGASAIRSNVKNLSLGLDTSRLVDDRGPLKVTITEQNKPVVEFDYAVDADTFNASALDFSNVSITKQQNAAFGYVVVSGLRLQNGVKKTISLDDVNDSKNAVCIKDSQINDIFEMSRNCKGANEKFVRCNGLDNSGYACSLDSSTGKYRVSGLRNSGVMQISEGDVSNMTGSTIVAQTQPALPLPPPPPAPG